MDISVQKYTLSQPGWRTPDIVTFHVIVHNTTEVLRCCHCFSPWRELKAEIKKALDKFFGWCDGGPANILSLELEEPQEKILQKIEQI
jgi:hypothetical protein